MSFLRRNVPIIICFVVGVFMAMQYYIPQPFFEDVFQEATSGYLIVAGFAFLLGLVSLIHLHFERVRRLEAGFGYSFIVFVGIAVMVAAGIVSGGETIDEGEMTPYGWMYDNIMVPLQATMFSILAFFIASAAFRAFRVRSVEAALLLLAAIVMMFARVPLGEYLGDQAIGGAASVVDPESDMTGSTNWVAEWLMGVPNMAARRGILFGVALGIIATSLKIIFGIERAYLGERE